MNFSEYQAHAARTANPKLNPRERVIQAAFGITGESGEIVDSLKKILYHGHDFNRDEFMKEAGDLLWYISELCSAWGIDLDEVAQGNIAKLKARYPVAFDPERSRNRDDAPKVEELYTVMLKAAGSHE